jgi:hypothetical protein
MATIKDLEIGKNVSFDTHTSSITGDINHAKVVGIVDSDSIRAYGVDPVSAHAQIQNMLPSDAPRSVTQYSFLVVKRQDGQYACFGIPWIKEATLTVHENQTGVYTIEGISGNEEHQRILNILRMNGFKNVHGQIN